MERTVMHTPQGKEHSNQRAFENDGSHSAATHSVVNLCNALLTQFGPKSTLFVSLNVIHIAYYIVICDIWGNTLGILILLLYQVFLQQPFFHSPT